MLKLKQIEGKRMLLFDTSALIELLKGNSVLKQYLSKIYCSSISVFELFWAAKRKGGRQFKFVKALIDRLEIIGVNKTIAITAASAKINLMEKGQDQGMADLLIGASVVDLGGTLVSFDQDFSVIAKEMKFKLDYHEMTKPN